MSIDERLSAGDPVAFFDAVTEAINELQDLRDEMDEALVSRGGALVGGRGSLTRLSELSRRAANGIALFDESNGRIGCRPCAANRSRHHGEAPPSHGR
jgi:hypothetical protein